MRKLQNELVEKQKRSEIAKLAIAVAHELNNPLCVINGNLDLLMNRIEGDEYTLKHLKNMKKMTMQMIEIVGKMNSLQEGYTTVPYAEVETMIKLSE
jgi:C4-dicarboxylate-specific signal transduction histidine kinase